MILTLTASVGYLSFYAEVILGLGSGNIGFSLPPAVSSQLKQE
jgi:hypothetical protein